MDVPAKGVGVEPVANSEDLCSRNLDTVHYTIEDFTSYLIKMFLFGVIGEATDDYNGGQSMLW